VRELGKAVPAIMRVLAAHGLTGEMVETAGPGDGTACARRAVEAGSEMVFACGGDGTVHEVLQGLVHTPSVLGVLPVGTANALARNLGLSLDPVAAVTQQMGFEARKIAVGEVCFRGSEKDSFNSQGRYFTVMAGAGPDGVLVYSMLAGSKVMMGRSAYYARAARLFMTRRFAAFRVRYRETGSTSWQERKAASVMGVRVSDLGGIFGRLTPGASLEHGALRLVMVRPPGLVSLPAWFALGHLGLNARNPWLEMVQVDEFECEAISAGDRVHAQVDGEWMGTLPMKVRMVPDAVRLLMPYSGLSCD
jgi:YegS/Rv2252/BmrU family lipid kinase